MLAEPSANVESKFTSCPLADCLIKTCEDYNEADHRMDECCCLDIMAAAWIPCGLLVDMLTMLPRFCYFRLYK